LPAKLPEPSADRNRTPLFFAAATAIFLFGIVLALLGTLFGLPQVLARLHVQMAEEGDLFLLLFLGVFAASVVAGPLIERMGNQRLLMVSALLAALGLLGIAFAESFQSAGVASFILGAGGGGLNTSGNVLVSELYGEARGSMLNLLSVFYGIGALAVPLIVASTGNRIPVRGVLIACGALAMLSALAYALLRFPPARQQHGFHLGDFLRVARSPGVVLLGVLLFFQSGNEGAIGGWTSAYLGTLGANANTATWVLTCYWLGMIVGRATAPGLLKIMPKTQLILLSGIGAFAGCGLLIFAQNIFVADMAATLIGLSFAAVYPTTLAIAGDRYADNAATVFGVLFAIGLLGGMSVPWAIGQVGNAWGLRAGMHLPLISTAMIGVLAVAIRLQLRKS
jgi:FHS family glucose/mannose:H+ symporter-like MFS transporter